MFLRKTIETLINTRKTGMALSICLLPLTALSFGYRLIVQTRTALYRHRLLSSVKLPCRVIVVGNITTGGTGKTPMVGFLSSMLQQQGKKVVVLTRGYGGKNRSGVVILSDGKRIVAGVEQVGDEAWMMASQLDNIPVICTKDRVKGGMTAIELFQPDIIILDDGFQHFRLQRDLDIVLVNAADPFGNGHMLPRGKLREPVGALKRADMVVITKSNLTEGSASVRQEIASLCRDIPVLLSELKPCGAKDPATGKTIGWEELQGKNIAAVCSIGDPEGFFSILEQIGTRVIAKLAFPDHHFYQKGDYRGICTRAAQADLVVTTEKDIAKIDPNMIDKKVVVLETAVVMQHQDVFLSHVLGEKNEPRVTERK